MIGESQGFSPGTVQSGTFYDMLALLCYKIEYLPRSQQENIYRIFNTGYAVYTKNVQNRFPFLSNSTAQPVYYYSLTSDQSKQIFEVLNSAESDADWAMLLAAIETIDRILELKANLEKFLMDKSCPVIPLDPGEQPHASSSYHQFDALNPGTKKFGLLLPREPCNWQRPSERTMDSVSFSPLSVMKNYIWVQPDLDYQIINLHSDFHFSSGGRLKMVTSPLSSQAPFLMRCHSQNNTFEIEYIDADMPKFYDKFEKAIHISANEYANIVMFPEMMASPASIRNYVKYVRDNWTLDMPNLILLPTCEYIVNRGWVNELTALDADGGCIFTYCKQHPFRFEERPEETPPDAEGADGSYPRAAQADRNLAHSEVFYEPIQADKRLYLLHVPGIGRIGFLICSDVFREGYLDVLLEKLKVTLLLHIVYSKGTDLLERALASAKRHLCDVVMCNTCAAWDNVMEAPEKRAPVHISDSHFINKYYPYGHNYNGTQPPSVTCERQECLGCAFVLEVANTYGISEISVSHRYE